MFSLVVVVCGMLLERHLALTARGQRNQKTARETLDGLAVAVFQFHKSFHQRCRRMVEETEGVNAGFLRRAVNRRYPVSHWPIHICGILQRLIESRTVLH